MGCLQRVPLLDAASLAACSAAGAAGRASRCSHQPGPALLVGACPGTDPGWWSGVELVANPSIIFMDEPTSGACTHCSWAPASSTAAWAWRTCKQSGSGAAPHVLRQQEAHLALCRAGRAGSCHCDAHSALHCRHRPVSTLRRCCSSCTCGAPAGLTAGCRAAPSSAQFTRWARASLAGASHLS